MFRSDPPKQLCAFPTRAGMGRRCAPARRRAQGRRGVASLFAMLYMLIFSALAIGFYGAVTMAVQVSHNDERVHGAQVAAESGLAWLRYQIGRVRVPSNTKDEELLSEVYRDLDKITTGSGNQGGRPITFDGEVIHIPAAPGQFIALDDERRAFRAEIRRGERDKLKVKIVGKYRGVNMARAVEMGFETTFSSSSVFGYGVVSRSPITMDSNARIQGSPQAPLGSVLIAASGGTSLEMRGNSSISGDVSVVGPETSVRRRPGSIGGNVYGGVAPPEFPQIDTSIYESYARNVLSKPGEKYDKGTLRNIRIKAGTNPTFDSNMTVEGVIYIETPNHVKFDSNVTIRGVIVVQNNPTGDTSTNSITFNSNVKMYGVDTLPPTLSYPPDLRALTGTAILAPKFKLHINSNAGSVGGVVAASQMEFDSNAKLTVKGTLLNLDPTSMHMDSNAVITVEELDKLPPGFVFDKTYKSMPKTYTEVLP